MYVLNYFETTKCKLFVTTLKLYARAWFASLPPRSIGNCPSKVHTASLMHIKQEENESLREYIERIKKGVAPIKDLRIQEAITYFT